MSDEHPTRGGLAWGLAAYIWWGLMPLYFFQVQAVPGWEILAHRIVWCGVLLAGLLTFAGRWPDVFAAFRSRRTAGALFACSLLLAFNWWAYILAALNGRIMEASLGYFILPLFNVLFGVAFFKERLRPAQAVAVVLAAAGVAYLIIAMGKLPWIALTLGVSFSIYGVLRKITPVDGLLGLFVETVFLMPPSMAAIAYWLLSSGGSFGLHDLQMAGWLLLSGPVTAVPLLCFGQAARRLSLSTIGFLQYLAPSIQFLLAFYAGEPFRHEQQISFGCIWVALAIYSVDSLFAPRHPGTEAPPAEE